MASELVAAVWADWHGGEWRTAADVARAVDRAPVTIAHWGCKGRVRRKREDLPAGRWRWLYHLGDARVASLTPPGGPRCTRCYMPMQFVGLCWDCWAELTGMAPWQVFEREGYYG